MKHHKLSFRADDPLCNGIKAMAERRGMSMSDYLRMMASLELMNQPPVVPKPVLQELKNTLVDLAEFASLDPTAQVAVLRRSIEALETAKQANDEALKWIFALANALDAYTRHPGVRPREPLDG